ncbi:adenylate/guanylate cyclase domain-containing protein [Curtobacterium sp. MCLR17_044]|uniref:adenylate/guanylate cyclase domain-containing protein n=1 Tax=Curtobacterium sp. MCLR17_044 TaxID=2175628 RepID=UPI000DA7AB06|nr:adenylate/guanylate cyclase domain-containing protein [Curtobacterium sp. MCLR17_044]PZE55462.1 adenylate/guanylate cyclase domain-containing protein [Curtobacterium sp. MCLR17_044]
MDGNYKPYDHKASSARMEEILDKPVGTFEEKDSLPDRDQLTFTNGFYSLCTAVFIDIRDSSGLTDKHKRPQLAKIYRSFISEMVAVLNSASFVREVNIVGDCVWAVYNTRWTSNIEEVFSIVAQANSVKDLLNHHLTARGIDPLAIGIGVDYGRALMIKAGYNGSAINDVVYMGDVVNSAAHLAHEAGRGWRKPVYLSTVFWANLGEDDQKLCYRDSVSGSTVYTANVVNIAMNSYINDL